ncbi:hypothetical protein SPOG_01125 [Schizosaccharomyces cryophilus OY26]|uniref:Selenoprotein O n=1 Tax=Schizosaccharomyces cryophilus (strain OY26 / ATCC MYA-4695 / CBS 11777 / NBRC 106824 / NRRL Y48691) TaxID=653667 RepID=S9X9H0_SCHCR|nr:uncharacterized protein SPOG_01125 [Schizosaccharomyces cryophilus OY26]EPY50366.1 hypothetical protein SPOG_01125 [Schizosaccharomyces cryophilus OY26]
MRRFLTRSIQTMSRKLSDLPVSSTFTANLTPDPVVPTVDALKDASDDMLHIPRKVKNGALFTYVIPSMRAKSRLLAYSPSCMRSLGLDESEAETEAFQKLVVGTNIDVDKCCPWSQCYGGYQFGDWAGQLGDGRVVSLCELTNPETKERYEIQVKGVGRTPYSRFADGKAVVRSSIREYLCCEALYALNIPTTRALAISTLDGVTAMRETVEPCAIVCRMAPSWIRIGTFDLPGVEGRLDTTRKLADYCLDHVLTEDFQGRGIGNRYEQLLRDVAIRNAKCVAKWQVYGFMNGVLNTDNTSILGLSIDFGPFSFMDTYNPSFTPNHDDIFLRYSYQRQPSIIIWNLAKLASALLELIGARDRVDDPQYMENLHSSSELLAEAHEYTLQAFENIAKEFLSIVREDYFQLMTARLGLPDGPTSRKHVIDALDILENHDLDYPNFFSFLTRMKVEKTDSQSSAEQLFDFCAGSFNKNNPRFRNEAVQKFQGWLDAYHQLSTEVPEATRLNNMKSVNPHFTLRNWVLEEVNKKAYEGDYDLFHKVAKMTASPFEDSWGFPKDFEDSYCYGTGPTKSQIQCSCSS